MPDVARMAMKKRKIKGYKNIFSSSTSPGIDDQNEASRLPQCKIFWV
jgi:hypothetical protein